MGMSVCDEQGRWTDFGGTIQNFELMPPEVMELREKYNLHFGEVELVHLSLPHIHIVYGDMSLKKHQVRFRSMDMPEYVELHFSLSGGSLIENHANGRKYEFNAMQHNIVYTQDFDGVGQYKNNESYKFFEVHFAREYFLQLVKDSPGVLSDFCEHVDQQKCTNLSEDNLSITFAMQQCIYDIMNTTVQGSLKVLFLQSKCIELLSLQVETYENAASNSVRSVLRSSYEKDCVRQARAYLNLHLDKTPTLAELSKIAGINEFKLKNGFKELFDTTVFGYLSDLRLLEAKEQLRSGKAIKVISDNLGYSSVQHFGTAFRKKFGTSPGKMKG